MDETKSATLVQAKGREWSRFPGEEEEKKETRTRAEGLTEDERHDAKDDQTEDRPDVAVAQDEADQL